MQNHTNKANMISWARRVALIFMQASFLNYALSLMAN
jgi:hypothetical protein